MFEELPSWVMMGAIWQQEDKPSLFQYMNQQDAFGEDREQLISEQIAINLEYH